MKGYSNAFGSLRYQSGTFDTDYSFTGYLKEETGSHYAKMRYYSAGIGRFLRPDPAGVGYNYYLYCENNPVKFVDRWGTFSQDYKFFLGAQFEDEIREVFKGLEALVREEGRIWNEIFDNIWDDPVLRSALMGMSPTVVVLEESDIEDTDGADEQLDFIESSKNLANFFEDLFDHLFDLFGW